MREITSEQRNRIVSLLKSGKSNRKVAESVGVSLGTVVNVGKSSCPDRERSKGGRPKILSPADQRYCVRLVTKQGMDNAVKVRKQLRNDHGINVSPHTVRRTLREAGLEAFEKEKKPDISTTNAKNRLEWCLAHRDWTSDDWKRVIWSDETKINRFNSDGRVWSWIRDGEQLQPKHVKATRKHGGGGIMFWSAISYAGVGWICKIDGIMDRYVYKQILEEDLSPMVNYTAENLGLQRDQLIFQQDNDTKHKSDVVMNYLSEQEFEVMDWPAQSPDLNPIENMWRLLKIKLNEYDTPPKGMNELYERVVHTWYNVITVEDCRKVIDSMPSRIEECIKAKGYWTSY